MAKKLRFLRIRKTNQPDGRSYCASALDDDKKVFAKGYGASREQAVGLLILRNAHRIGNVKVLSDS